MKKYELLVIELAWDVMNITSEVTIKLLTLEGENYIYSVCEIFQLQGLAKYVLK